MKVKTQHLSGAALNYAVAIAAYKQPPHKLSDDIRGMWWAGECDGGIYDWEPTIHWHQIGPLIEKYRVDIVSHRLLNFAAYINNSAIENGDPDGCGNNHKIAACRSIVQFELGDEVDIPDGV